MGTPTYLAPEQVSAGKTGPQSDIYALGAVLYELLSGSRLYRASSVKELLGKIVTEDPLPLIEVV